jgi:hypothetical protein
VGHGSAAARDGTNEGDSGITIEEEEVECKDTTEGKKGERITQRGESESVRGRRG